MKRFNGCIVAVLALTAPVVHAQDRALGARAAEAPLLWSRALEVGLAVGADQIHGSLGGGLDTLSELGAALDLELAWRIDSRWAVGVHASGGAYGGGTSMGRSLAAGLQATHHFLPGRAHRPWISVGTGWRAQWLSGHEGDGPCHGLEIVRLWMGIEQAAARRVSVSPVLGATLATFLSYGDGAGRRDVRDPRPSVLVFAGLMTRFELGGRRVDLEPPR